MTTDHHIATSEPGLKASLDRIRRWRRSEREVWRGGPRCLEQWRRGPRRWQHLWTYAWESVNGDEDFATPAVELREHWTLAAIVAGLADFCDQRHRRPARIEVDHADLAVQLHAALAGLGFEAESVGDHLGNVPLFPSLYVPPPELSDTPALTPARIAAFERAVVRFRSSSPWRRFRDGDMVEILRPTDRGSRFALLAVDSRHGSHTDWISFFNTAEEMEFGRDQLLEDPHDSAIDAINSWMVEMGSIDQRRSNYARGYLPSPDVRRQMPDGRLLRPTPRRLAWIEGFLRVLANFRRRDFDGGWHEKRVRTLDGWVTFVMRLIWVPDTECGDVCEVAAEHPELSRRLSRLVVPPATVPRPMVDTTQRQEIVAQLLTAHGYPGGAAGLKIEEAFDAEDDETVVAKLAEAAQLAPGSPLLLLAVADELATGDDVLVLTEHALNHAREQLISAATRRPRVGVRIALDVFLTALCTRALVLIDAGATAEAVPLIDEIEKFNPKGDRDGRVIRLACLLRNGDYDRARAFMEASDPSDSALWVYAKPLLAFIRSGNCHESRAALEVAIARQGWLVASMWFDTVGPPGWCSVDGVFGDTFKRCMRATIKLWRSTPGALGWLQTVFCSRAR